MKVVILAGGLGTRISEESQFKPKPMIEIGGLPILLHIMKIYSFYGFNDFVILLGYKGYIIKEYFKNYFLHNSDFEVNLKNPNENTKNELRWLTSMITPDLISKIHLVAEKYPEFKKRLDKYTGDDKEDNNDKRVYTSRGTRVGSSLV